MNDDELDKLFGQDGEDTTETLEETEPSVNEGEVNASEENVEAKSETEEVTIIEEDDTPEVDEEAIATRKAAQKEAYKKQVRLERIRKIEAFEENAKRKMEVRKQKWRDAGSLKDRQYLEDFPLSYRTVLFVLLALVLLVFAWSLAFHPYFRVNKVTVTGNYEMSEEEILSGLDIQYGSHMFRNYYASGKNLISKNPYIEKISIKRDFPSSLEIQVVERRKIAYISTPDGYIAIDDEGTVLEISADKEAQVRPLLCGIDIDNATLGKKVDILQNNSFRKMIIVLSAALSASEAYDGAHNADYDFFGNIKEIRIISSGTFFVTVVLPNGGDLQVKLRNMNTITDDMQWLVYTITEDAYEGLPDGVLDMTGESYIYRRYGYEMVDNNSIAKNEE